MIIILSALLVISGVSFLTGIVIDAAMMADMAARTRMVIVDTMHNVQLFFVIMSVVYVIVDTYEKDDNCE